MYRMMLVTITLANAASAARAMPPNDDFRRRTIVTDGNVNTQAATPDPVIPIAPGEVAPGETQARRLTCV